MIAVENSSPNVYKVTVKGAATTVHTVTVTPEYLQKLTTGRASAETLVQKSFEFLLEHESNTSILQTFDLPVIQHYFPEYERATTSALDEL